MNVLLLLLIIGCVEKCYADDSNSYYLVEKPPRAPLKVYWNVPTKQCKSKKILFDDLFKKYGIIQNTQDTFPGDKMSILYDPGLFPALLSNGKSNFAVRNGGVPQEGDLKLHLNEFKKRMDESIDKDFNGVGVIDFESWRPILRQNFGNLAPYKNFSYDIERDNHPWWFEKTIKAEAKRRFETAGKQFMQQTLELAKQLRPNALWGYYAYPYCFNMGRDMQERCSNVVQKENDEISWLWKQSTALFPSVYSSKTFTTSQVVSMIRGRVAEAARIRTGDQPILPYFWYRYRDGEYLKEVDLRAALKTFYNSEASGFIIWGSSDDVKTVDKCKNLLHYIDTIFGPAIAKYTKKIDNVSPSTDNNSNNEINISTTRTQEVHNNNFGNGVAKDNKTTIDDDRHHIEVIKALDMRPEIADELNHTLWRNVNMTVLDAIVQTWLLNLDNKDPNKFVKTKNMTITKHMSSGTSNDAFNVTYTNVSIYATENPINNKVTKDITKINTLTESPIREDESISLDREVTPRKNLNITYISKNLKKGLPKLNLSEISKDRESGEDFPVKLNTTQTFNSKNKKKGLPKSNPTPVTNIVLPSATTAFTNEAEIVTTTEMSTEGNLSKEEKKGRLKFEDLESTDVSQVSEETYVEPSDDLKSYDNKYLKNGLMALQPKSEIVHNFLDLSKEGLNQDSKKYIKKGLSKSYSIRRHETATGKAELDIAYEGEPTEQYAIHVTTENVTINTEENVTVTTEEITNSTVQLYTGITRDEVTQSDDIESRTLTNIAKSLILTTDKVELLQVAKKGVERSVDDAEEKSEDSLDSEKEQVSRSQSLRPRYMFCFIFYFYSFSKCLCDTFGVCLNI
ncbi:uncharacterized protein LOC113238609 isoform X2 [Hyposmocoma kahamanoa]|uniref:uncharacterized protein LOC113238609 isoform X2 n=1 Tax=Hyposmocoma kahamanoa TaxID=1477025 RepID=UPI000E6D5D1B|nr:uncharacterized protein LOC113238609 isoform X2 [Hyposmocoma kahamanoa]